MRLLWAGKNRVVPQMASLAVFYGQSVTRRVMVHAMVRYEYRARAYAKMRQLC